MKAKRLNKQAPALPLLLLLLAVPAAGRSAEGPAERQRYDVDGELDKVERKIATLRNKLALVESEYGESTQVEKTTPPTQAMERRTNDGQVFFLSKDFVRAAIVFYDLVENPEYAGRPGHDERMFYLAESMFQNRNFLGARKYYSQIADLGPSNRYFFKSLPRLVEIAASLDQYEGLDRHFKRLQGRPRSEVGEEIYYIHAKSLFDRGKLDEAEAEFAAFPDSSSLARRARYFRGVIAISRGAEHFETALEHFRGVGQLPEGGEGGAELADLAQLGIGRVLLEQNKIDEAMSAYQTIDRNSAQFDDALYETTWAWVRRANQAENAESRGQFFKKSIETLELLLAALPDSQLLPRAKLLKGDLLLRMRKLDSAAEAFEEVVDQFEPVKTDLEQIIAEHEDPKRYFNEIMGRNIERFDVSSFLPPLAIKWATTSNEVQRALRAVQDLNESNALLEEAEKIAKQLESAAEQSAEQGVLPRLRDGRDTAVAVKDTGNELRRRLAELETEVLLEAKVRQGETEEERQIGSTVLKVHRTLPKLHAELDSLYVLLRAAAKWCQDTDMERGLSEEEKQFCDERVYQEMNKLEELSSETEFAGKSLRETMEKKGLDDWVEYEEARRERRKWEKLVSEMPKTLSGIQERDDAAAERVGKAQQEILKLSIELDNFEAQLQAIEQWRRESYSRRKISKEHEERFRQKIANEHEGIREMRLDLNELRDDLAAEAARVSALGVTGAGDEQTIRTSYQKALAREKELFQRLRRNLDEKGTRRVARIDELRSRIDGLDGAVDGFLSGMEKRTGEQTGKMSGELVQALEELQAYATQVKALKDEAESVAGSIAYDSFQGVREQFYRLVLRADVGLIDVAWAETEGQNQEKADLVQKKADEVREVYNQFQDVLDEMEE